MKKYKKLISILALVAIILGILPLSIFASEDDDIADIEVPLEPEIKITEVVDRREESIKHFKMPDGTYNAISYAGAVHRKNSDGEWIDINNDLSLKTVGSKQLYTTNDSRVTFSKSYSSNEDIMELRENGYVISMALLSEENDGDMSMDMNDNASLVTVNNSDYIRPESFDTIDEAIEINNKSSISYSNVLADTDIEYVMNGNDIKENIIVKDRSDSYVYAFRLSLDGLIPILDESGAIYLNDSETEETIYVIPAPYMYDSNDEYSEEVYYELFHVEGDKYLLTVTADESWINNQYRSFPVTIDPSVVTSSSAIVDTYLNSSNPTVNYGTKEYMFVSPSCTAMVRLAFPTLPEFAELMFADLNLNYYFPVSSGNITVGVYQILDEWVENSVTYNSKPTFSDSFIYSKSLSASSSITSSSPRAVSLDILSAAQQWYDGADLWGIAISRLSGTTSSLYFKSSEAGNYINISVTYRHSIADGIYGIKNLGYSNRWLTVKSDNEGRLENNIMQQKYYSSSEAPTVTNSSNNRYSLFKIIRRGSSDIYDIRLMTNNALTMGVTSDKVKTQPLNDEHSGFRLEWRSTGFLIIHEDTSKCLSIWISSEEDITAYATDEISSGSKWTFVPLIQEEPPSNDAEVSLIHGTNFTTQDIIEGSSADVIVSATSDMLYANTVEVTHLSEYDHIAVSSWNSATNTLSITGINPGRYIISVSVKNDYTGESILSDYYSFYVIPPEGTYILQNSGSAEYLSLQNTTVFTNLNYSNSNTMKWVLEHVVGDSGYVTLRSAENPFLYLGLNSNNSDNVTLYVTANDYSKWKIETTETGNLKLTCQATEPRDGDKVLGIEKNKDTKQYELKGITYVPAGYTSAGTYNSASHYDEWYLLKKVITYVNYYDSSFESEMQQLIPSAISFQNMVYARNYNIGFYNQSLASYSNVDLAFDNCASSGTCNCSAEHKHHHTNINKISENLYKINTQDDHIFVLWTNRPPNTYCYVTGATDNTVGEHETIITEMAVVVAQRPVVHIMRVDSNTIPSGRDSWETIMGILLAHETAHTFKMYEAYDNIGHDVEKEFVCIMEEYEYGQAMSSCNNIKKGIVSPFCGTCSEYMENLTNNLAIVGYKGEDI